MWLAFLNLIEFKNQLEKNSTHIDKQSVEFILLNNPLTLSYHAMNLFVKIFMPTLFFDDDFICLQSCFCLLRLLLKYHDPERSTCTCIVPSWPQPPYPSQPVRVPTIIIGNFRLLSEQRPAHRLRPRFVGQVGHHKRFYSKNLLSVQKTFLIWTTASRKRNYLSNSI